MNREKASMPIFSKPGYLIPAIILVWMIIYFVYYAFDKVGLETQTASAVVTAKNYTPGSTTFVNRIIGGRSWTQAQKQSDFYAVALTIDNESAVALVSVEKFNQLKKNDRVQVTYRRTRISGKIEVMNVL